MFLFDVNESLSFLLLMSSLSTEVGFPFTYSTHANRKIETNSQDFSAFHTESFAVRKLPIFISSSHDLYSHIYIYIYIPPSRREEIKTHEKENKKKNF